MIEYVRYVRLDQVEDYCRLGWMPVDINGGRKPSDYHAQWSIIMRWPCDCPPLALNSELDAAHQLGERMAKCSGDPG